MENHFRSLEEIYGFASIRLPNDLFRKLSSSIKNKNDNTNIQQVAFAYTYLITISFLYKYAHFVDTTTGTYIQNGDIKELLGYNRITKTIDIVIKKGGILDEIGLTETTKDYPVRFKINYNEQINKIPIREFITIGDLDENDILYDELKKTVKNRNYEIKHPLFLTSEREDNPYGTLYGIERTHEITLDEFLAFMFDDELCNIDFLMYGYFKSRCKGYLDNKKEMAIYKIVLEIGIDKGTFYNHLDILKKKKYLEVNHSAWRMKGERYVEMKPNEYIWKGVCK